MTSWPESESVTTIVNNRRLSTIVATDELGQFPIVDNRLSEIRQCGKAYNYTVDFNEAFMCVVIIFSSHALMHAFLPLSLAIRLAKKENNSFFCPNF